MLGGMSPIVPEGMMPEQVGAFFFYTDHRYDFLLKNAVASFKAWHPDIPVVVVGPDNFEEYGVPRELATPEYSAKIRCSLASFVMRRHHWDKLIFLGSDTITCARLDRFVGPNVQAADAYLTLSYPYQLVTTGWDGKEFVTPTVVELKDGSGGRMIVRGIKEGGLNLAYKVVDHLNFNSDVACYTNPDLLKEISRLVDLRNPYFEEAVLNSIIWRGELTAIFVDFPYLESKVVYNVRAKGNYAPNAGSDFFGKYIQKYSVMRDEKLLDASGKHIHVYHYAEGFGTYRSQFTFSKKVQDHESKFNQATRNFFQERCGCVFQEAYGKLTQSIQKTPMPKPREQIDESDQQLIRDSLL